MIMSLRSDCSRVSLAYAALMTGSVRRMVSGMPKCFEIDVTKLIGFTVEVLNRLMGLCQSANLIKVFKESKSSSKSNVDCSCVYMKLIMRA